MSTPLLSYSTVPARTVGTIGHRRRRQAIRLFGSLLIAGALLLAGCMNSLDPGTSVPNCDSPKAGMSQTSCYIEHAWLNLKTKNYAAAQENATRVIDLVGGTIGVDPLAARYVRAVACCTLGDRRLAETDCQEVMRIAASMPDGGALPDPGQPQAAFFPARACSAFLAAPGNPCP